MSATVDSRVVEMRFDNRQFESGVATTMNTLDKFQRSLKMEGATKGLVAVQAAANKIDFTNVQNMATNAAYQVQGVWKKVADLFEYYVAAKVIKAGVSMGKALAIDPIKTGLAEYETQINAVQTILANTESKGTTLDQVNSALDTLNTYADKTIYNFTEMTNNIGKFTAAGVDLDTSVNAIQGIANLAAMSGSTSQQASTAMYQLSQALASGTVKLMDWNSVVNAGMGGQVFQDALKETARVHGIAIDNMIKKHGSFRETLSEGWITSEILTETLSHFTMAAEEGSEQWEKYKKSLMDQGYSEEQAKSILKLSNSATDAATKVKTATQLWSTLKETAQSGWTQTWELIIGDFEQAKELFSGIYETLAPILESTAKARNTLLQGALTSNWDKMLAKINEAGVATDKFEAKLRSTAEAHGIDVDKLVEDYGSLEKAFRSGAISSDILKEAIKGLEGNLLDLSDINRDLNWGATGEDVKKVQQALEDLGHSVGDPGIDGIIGSETTKAIKAFQEASGLKVTGVVDAETLRALEDASGKIEGLSDSIGGLIDDIDKLGGRELLIDSLKNIFEAFVSIVKPIGKAFRDIFPTTTAEQLYSIIEAFNKFTEKLKLSDKASENLRRTFKGIFAIVDIIKQLIFAVAKALAPLIGLIVKLAGYLLGLTGDLGDWLANLNDAIRTNNVFGTAMEKVAAFVVNAAKKIRSAFGAVKDFFVSAGKKIGEVLQDIKDFFAPVTDEAKRFGDETGRAVSAAADIVEKRFSPLIAIGNFIKKVFFAIGGAIKKVFPIIGGVLKGIGSAASDTMSRVADALENADYNTVIDILNSGILAAIGIYIAKFIKGCGKVVDEAGGFLENIKGILDGVKGCLTEYQNSIKADVLKKIAVAIAILAGALLVLAFIPSDRLLNAIIALTVLFIELGWFTKSLQKLGDTKGMNKTTTVVKKLASALITLSIALKIMSTMSWSEMGVALVSMTVGLGALVGAVWLLSKIPEKKLWVALVNIKALKMLVSAMVTLSIVLKIMSTMSWEGMGVALISMTVGLGVLIGAIYLLAEIPAKKVAIAMVNVKAVKKLASAMLVLSIALKIMSTMSAGEMGIALIAMAAGLGMMVIAINKLPKNTAAKAFGISTLAAAMVILGAALKIMATMSWGELAVALVALGGSLVILVGALNLMKKAVPGAIAIAIVAPSLLILAGVLKILSGLSWSEVATGLVALGGSLIIIAVAMNLMKGAIGGAVALILVAAALTVLTPVLMALGAMSWESIGKSLLMLAGVFAVLGISAAVLTPVIPAIIALSIAVTLLGIACLAIGAGVTLLSTGIRILVGALAAGGESIVSFIKSVVSAIPYLIDQIGLIIVRICEVIAGAVGAICDAVVAIIVAVVDAIIIAAPKLVDGLLTLIVQVLESLVANLPTIVSYVITIINVLLDALIANLPTIVDKVVTIIVGVLNLLAERMPEIMDAIFTFLVSVIDGLAAGITRILEPILNFLANLFTGIAEILGPIVQEVLAPILGVLADLFVGLFEAMAPYLTPITELIATMTETIMSAIIEVTNTLAPFIPVVTDAIVKITDIIVDAIVKITEVLAPFIPDITKMITDITEVITDAIVKITDVLAPFIPDLADMISDITDSFVDMLETISPTIDSIKDLFDTLGTKVNDIMTTVKDTIVATGDAITEPLEAMEKIFDTTFDGISGVLDSVGDSIKKALEGISDVIESVGKAALDAGTGFEKLASGVKTITGLNLLTISTNLGAVATGIAGITAVSDGLGDAGVGMAHLADAAQRGSKAFDTMTGNVTTVTSIFSSEKVTVENITTAFENLKNAVKGFNDLSIETIATGMGDIAVHADDLDKAGTGMTKLATGSAAAAAGFAAISTNTTNILGKLTAMVTSIDVIVSTFRNSASRVRDAGAAFISAAISGINSGAQGLVDTVMEILKQSLEVVDNHTDKVEKACTALASAGANAVSEESKAFEAAGKNLVKGFANGISVNTYMATAKSKAMAKAAADAAKKELDEHSPSKVGYGIGNFFGVAFINGIADNVKSAYKVSASMASSARDGVNKAINKMNAILSSDIDTQPTIRPVIDLSDVRSGANAISGMLNLDSHVGVHANLAAISATMAQRGQNGFNEEVVSAINKLRKDISNVGGGDTYQVNGVTYDDGSNVTEAVKSIVRYARIERRV